MLSLWKIDNPWLSLVTGGIRRCLFLPIGKLSAWYRKTDYGCRYCIGSKIVCWSVQGLFLYKPVSFPKPIHTCRDETVPPCRLWRHTPISVSPNRSVVFPDTEKTSAAVIPYRFPDNIAAAECFFHTRPHILPTVIPYL